MFGPFRDCLGYILATAMRCHELGLDQASDCFVFLGMLHRYGRSLSFFILFPCSFSLLLWPAVPIWWDSCCLFSFCWRSTPSAQRCWQTIGHAYAYWRAYWPTYAGHTADGLHSRQIIHIHGALPVASMELSLLEGIDGSCLVFGSAFCYCYYQVTSMRTVVRFQSNNQTRRSPL